MKLTLLGSGYGTSTDNTPSSIIFSKDGINLLIDCTIKFTEQIEKQSIEKIDALIITHGHKDAIEGLPQLKEFLKGKVIPAVMYPTTFKKLEQLDLDLSFLDIKFFTPMIQFQIGTMNVTPIYVKHTLNKETEMEYPTFAIAIDKVVYADDIGEIPGDSMPYFENADILILDAKTWFGKQDLGHFNIKTALEFGKQFKPNVLVLTGTDESYPEYNESVNQINKFWKRIRGNKNTDIILANDGLSLISNFSRKRLFRDDYGIYLAPPNASQIIEGKKNLIINSEYIPSISNKLLYLIQDDLCYGIIKLNEPKLILKSNLNKLKKYHMLNEESINQWWSNKKKLSAYSFELIHKFNEPIKVELKKFLNSFIDKVNFIDTKVNLPLTEELITETSLPKPFSKVPQKPFKETFINLNELNNYPYYLELKEDGQYFLAEKDGNSIKIYFESKAEIPNTVKSTISTISDNNFIIEGQYLNENQIKVWDIIKFNNYDLRQVPLRTRKYFIKKLNFNKEINYIDSIFIKNKEELLQFINNTNEYILKEIDSKYNSGRNKSWVKVKLNGCK